MCLSYAAALLRPLSPLGSEICNTEAQFLFVRGNHETEEYSVSFKRSFPMDRWESIANTMFPIVKLRFGHFTPRPVIKLPFTTAGRIILQFEYESSNGLQQPSDSNRELIARYRLQSDQACNDTEPYRA